MLGAIEAGGTKFVCAVADEETLTLAEKVTIPTTTPKETFAAVFKFFDEYDVKAIGIGSFGPIDIRPESKTYGYITTTPKRHWVQTDFVGAFKERYDVPIGFSTDVNAAALGEVTYGAARGKQSAIYLTVGTGIGGGAVRDGKVLEGYGHPEMGHVLVRTVPGDLFGGVCPYHGDCLEGMASGPALARRFGTIPSELPRQHEAWELVADYLAQAAVSYTLTLRPEQIIFGGGVMKQEQIFPLLRRKFVDYLNDYVKVPPPEEYLVAPGLGAESGIVGSLLLARQAARKE